MNQFKEIFERLPAEAFRKDPRTILSLMMDFGFDRRHVKMLRTVIEDDPKDFNEFLFTNQDPSESLIDSMAEHCLVSKDALSEIMHAIKDALSTDNAQPHKEKKEGQISGGIDGEFMPPEDRPLTQPEPECFSRRK